MVLAVVFQVVLGMQTLILPCPMVHRQRLAYSWTEQTRTRRLNPDAWNAEQKLRMVEWLLARTADENDLSTATDLRKVTLYRQSSGTVLHVKYTYWQWHWCPF